MVSSTLEIELYTFVLFIQIRTCRYVTIVGFEQDYV